MEHDYAKLAQKVQMQGVSNQQVLNAIATTPRHQFMPKAMQAYAEENRALPIDANQTISQPYVVARMTEALLEHGPLNKVLEVGTGSGYQAAILSHVCKEVYSIERIHTLYSTATERFHQLHYTNIHTHYGDGYLGWPEQAPFDGIIVTAATNQVPQALLNQLDDGANLIIPIGNHISQELQLITRKNNDFTVRYLDPVVFVPMIKGVD